YLLFTFSSENGELFSCGQNGQLGLNDNTGRNTFQKVAKIIQISSGKAHALVLTGMYFLSVFVLFIFLDDFLVYSCGWNHYGQLGLNDRNNPNKLELINSLKEKKIIQIECGSRYSIALTGN